MIPKSVLQRLEYGSLIQRMAQTDISVDPKDVRRMSTVFFGFDDNGFPKAPVTILCRKTGAMLWMDRVVRV